ncbi:MAG: hypothetical protein APG08_00385 [Candidatus Methanofastidiosum methylothiophilum]|uniref:Uncharacterized protein n=1 Tax=Candidatus Methanofastidiosum methylothiophilum TaxID=1705564 RepID=A0A150JEB4_9EURY|nr:MAG: hypothetical protein AN188_00237 [Candidatus Methanofastidiosum methylthiophilus]KYC57104.1 MAG: hypothetical protein APG08_00385 [Candidatus Methanofastidiosum methylthiophilus]OQC52522.1 MAG: hypothetical protein BWX56_00239 [Euryarchaeota archaeon ADurb.Bin023]
MAEQNVKITVTAEDRASGPLKNVSGALGGLQKESSRVSGAMSSLGRAAETAGGMIVANYGVAAVSAVQRLAKEMVTLSVAQSRFQSQTQNLFQNLGLQAYSKDVESVISKHEAMTSFDDNEIRQSFNTLISSTGDYKKSLEILSMAEDLAAAKGIDLTSATNMINQALDGSYTQLKRQGLTLDETKLKTLDAANQYLYLKQVMEQTFGGSSEALRQSAAGILQNYQNQFDNVKKLFGSEMLESMAPTLDSIATKLSTLMETGKIQPLVTSFGNLFSEVWNCGSALGTLTMKLTGLTDEEEAINSIANAFDRVSVMVKSVNGALERMQTIIGTLHLDKIINMGLRMSDPGGSALWDWAGQQVETDKASQMTPYETYVRNQANGVSPGDDGTKTKRDENKTISEGISVRNTEIMSAREYLETVLRQTDSTRNLNGTVNSTTPAIGKLGDTAASAIANINSTISSFHASLGQGGGGGSGGGGGCRTFGSSERVQAGNDIVYEGPERGGAYVSNSFSSGGNTYETVRSSAGGGLIGYVNSATGEITKSVNDALITSKGDVIKFHPDDNILAFKGNGPKGGNNITNNFYISGSNDPDKIADEIMKKIQRIGRIGF